MRFWTCSTRSEADDILHKNLICIIEFIKQVGEKEIKCEAY